MAIAGLSKLEVPALLKLRSDIDARLKSLHESLQKQLAFFAGPSAPSGQRGTTGRRRAHALKGTKRPAKYRDPATGKTWAGVGMLPLWLKAYEAAGKKREQFSTGQGTGAASKVASSKKRGRKKKKAKVK